MSTQDRPCETCKDDPMVCAAVPGLHHCEKATRATPAPEARSAGNTARERITASQPTIPEPWMPEHLLDDEAGLEKILTELAGQLGVMNDFYYPLLSAAALARASSPDAGNGSREGGANPVGGAVIAMPPEGFALVPLEPTREMMLRGSYALDYRDRIEDGASEEFARNMADLRGDKWTDYAREIYQAMIEAFEPRQGDRAGPASTHSPQPEPISSPDAERIRAAALEEAAKVADRLAEAAQEQIDRNDEYMRKTRSFDQEPNNLCRHRKSGAEEIARGIRALQSPAPEGE